MFMWRVRNLATPPNWCTGGLFSHLSDEKCSWSKFPETFYNELIYMLLSYSTFALSDNPQTLIWKGLRAQSLSKISTLIIKCSHWTTNTAAKNLHVSWPMKPQKCSHKLEFLPVSAGKDNYLSLNSSTNRKNNTLYVHY